MKCKNAWLGCKPFYNTFWDQSVHMIIRENSLLSDTKTPLNSLIQSDECLDTSVTIILQKLHKINSVCSETPEATIPMNALFTILWISDTKTPQMLTNEQPALLVIPNQGTTTATARTSTIASQMAPYSLYCAILDPMHYLGGRVPFWTKYYNYLKCHSSQSICL
jgi:hypothetical protein